jgi:hypothetical protein
MKKTLKKTDASTLQIVKPVSIPAISVAKQTSGDKKFDNAIDRIFGNVPKLATK